MSTEKTLTEQLEEIKAEFEKEGYKLEDFRSVEEMVDAAFKIADKNNPKP